MEERRYYICHLKINRRHFFLIWYSDEIDGIMVGEDSKILTFSNQKILRAFAEKQKIKLENENVAFYDLNIIQKWLRNPTYKIDCKEFLDTWNLFTDVSASVNWEFRGRKRSWVRNLVYDKLFFGLNLFSSSLNPDGKKFYPKWSMVEISVLASIMKDGLQMFKQNVSLQ